MSQQDDSPREGASEAVEKSLTGSAYIYTSNLDRSDETTETIIDADNDE